MTKQDGDKSDIEPRQDDLFPADDDASKKPQEEIINGGTEVSSRPGRPHRAAKAEVEDSDPSEQQASLFSTAEEPPDPWPDPALLPHNEAQSSVREAVRNDVRQADSALFVVGYASLEEIVRFLAGDHRPGHVRILFGNEPFPTSRQSSFRSGTRLADDIRDFWLEQGLSVDRCADVIRVKALLRSKALEVRVAQKGQPVHAKVYVATGVAATLGSSNFTPAGLARQSELNARFECSDERYPQVERFAEALWERGEDYAEEFEKLLDQLLKPVTWQEAVARACAEVLEGAWARQYVPPEELADLDPPLWPHQLQGISQAIWTLHNLGSVLIADATGSGKTRMGAWLLRAAYDRLTRSGHAMRVEQVVVAPPAVADSWQDELQKARLRWRVDSHGLLSSTKAEGHKSLLDAIGTTELLAIDEAHNFLNVSQRTRRVLEHYADNVVLFTATPINRGAADLLAMVELLGADNFPDEALSALKALRRLGRSGATGDSLSEQREALKRHIGSFMVRRTRNDLNQIAADAPDTYQLPSGRVAGYPRHEANFYDLESSREDVEIAAKIVALADELIGVGRMPSTLELPRFLAELGVSEADYLRRVVRSAAALARHLVLDCLRSSRAALVEHVLGTRAARSAFDLKVEDAFKDDSGDVAGKLSELAGQLPAWRLQELPQTEAPSWLVDSEAHVEACRLEAARYDRIAELTKKLSPAREVQKAELLQRLFQEVGLVIAFDSHLLSLAVFRQQLDDLRVLVRVFTGAKGKAAKREASELLGLGSDRQPMVALCSDALSEGLNLQGASVVVHLDTPTVIRTAEQRAGRVDRMNSDHDTVRLYWPRDAAAFAPRKRDVLRERHEVVAELIGANLEMPEDDTTSVIDVQDLAETASVARLSDTSDLYDAFRPIRELIGKDRLVPTATYELMRTSQADVVAAVSIVRSEQVWGFFAVGGARRMAPRWVFHDGSGDGLLTDLGPVANALRERLGPETVDRELDEHVRSVIKRLLGDLRRNERSLLPVRRQRALRLADDLTSAWIRQAQQAKDWHRLDVLRHLQQLLVDDRSGGATAVDLRALADAWLVAVRPARRRVLDERRNRQTLWTVEALKKYLQQEEPLSTDVLERLLDVPRLAPIEQRVVAMVIGVPSGREAGGTPRSPTGE